MTAKLHINMSQGLIDIEGEPDLVREIYKDFKDILLSGAATPASLRDSIPESSDEGETVKTRGKSKRRPAKKRVVGEDSGPTLNPDAPKLDKNLDTSGLPAFYDRYEAKNNAEKILIFTKFMNDELGIDDPNTDQYYTCFEKVNERVPKVFSQSFRDASGRKFGFIDYNSPIDIRTTTVGNNHFKFDLKKKVAE